MFANQQSAHHDAPGERMVTIPNTRSPALLAAALLIAAPVAALEFDLGDFRAEAGGVLSTGVAIRTSGRDNRLLGKTDVPGQQLLCAEDDCMSLSGSPEPNQRLVNAVGAYAGVNSDNGNLNYDKFDPVAATTKFTPAVNLSYGPLSAKLRGIFYYDPINVDFDESRTNTLYQPAEVPRRDSLTRRFARGYKWREASVSLSNERARVTLGNQLLVWGEASLTQFNTLSAANPLDANVVRMPGAQINEFLRPIPAISVSGEVSDGLTAEAFYQLRWQRLMPDTVGSFFSNSNVIGGGRFIMTGLGQFANDPDGLYRPPGATRLISSSTRTARLLDEDFGYPGDQGQFGVQFKYYAADLNGGTELGLVLMRYHSRVPYLSVFAAQSSCTRDGAAGSFAAALVACNGFNGAVSLPAGREPLPVDTLRPFLDYPEGVQLLGLSFNTTAGPWSLAGEASYRPNLPLQVAVSDLLFAGLQPAFPEADIPLPTQLLGNAAPLTIPGARTAIPDFLSGYRGITIGGGDRVRGWERFQVGQFSLTGIRQYSITENPFGANALTWVVEFSATTILDRPPLSKLQLEGAGDRTHYGPAADGSGDPDGVANSLRINPTQQRKGFATPWAYGYRTLARLTYNNLIEGVQLLPALLLFHDLGGISSANTPNFVSGRKTLYALLDVELNQNLKLNLQYQFYTGGGIYNVLNDRDNLALSLTYAF
ncbi:MAG: DUF1302 family protein [Gammaproteobacteria bacterium]|nr:DUF1302 family protein [Gammaproteobacteria bacterium]